MTKSRKPIPIAKSKRMSRTTPMAMFRLVSQDMAGDRGAADGRGADGGAGDWLLTWSWRPQLGQNATPEETCFHNYHRKTWPQLPPRIVFMREYHTFGASARHSNRSGQRLRHWKVITSHESRVGWNRYCVPMFGDRFVSSLSLRHTVFSSPTRRQNYGGVYGRRRTVQPHPVDCHPRGRRLHCGLLRRAGRR